MLLKLSQISQNIVLGKTQVALFTGCNKNVILFPIHVELGSCITTNDRKFSWPVICTDILFPIHKNKQRCKGQQSPFSKGAFTPVIFSTIAWTLTIAWMISCVHTYFVLYFSSLIIYTEMSSKIAQKWVHNPFLNFKVHTVVEKIADVNAPS